MSGSKPVLVHDRQAFEIDAEQAILGALLFDNALHAGIAKMLGPDDFLEPAHGRLFANISELILRGEKADALTLRRFVELDSALSGLGGGSYLVALTTWAPSAESAASYARFIRERSHRRTLNTLAHSVLTQLQESSRTAAETRAWLDAELGAMAEQADDERRISMADACIAGFDMVMKAIETGYPPGTTLTGLPTLDHAIGGFRPGHVVLIAAAGSIGKSLLATRIAHGAASGAGYMPPRRVLFLTPEMPAGENVIRMAAARATLHYSDLERGAVSDEDLIKFKDAMAELTALPITWREGGGIAIERLQQIVKAEQRRPGLPLGLVIIDPVGYLHAPGSNDTERNSAKALALEELASTCQIPVVATHHLRKLEDAKDHRPTELHIRDSGRYYDFANEVVLLHRDSHWARKEPKPEDTQKREEWRKRCETNEMEFLVAKRRGGPVGWRKIGCNVKTGGFWELDGGYS